MAITDSDIRLQDLDINHQGPDVKHQDSGIDHQNPDIEHQFVPGGYERLANWMSLHPELSIFRRFGSLYTESILYLQAEIAQLEERLRQIRPKERKDGLRPELHLQLQEQSWDTLSSNSDAEQGSPGREKFEIHMMLRNLLAQYYQALDLQSKVQDLRRPHRKALKGLRMYMNRPCMGNIKILSPDWRTWGDENEHMENDLLTFENCIMDTFSSFLNYGILDIYDKCVGRHIRKITRTRNGSNILPLTSSDRNVVTYSYSTIALFAQSVTVLLACMLPIAAIMLLNSIDDMTKRLNVIACLTGAFSVSMRLFTMATLAEIFAATAAFAAVLVVFLSASDPRSLGGVGAAIQPGPS